MGLKSEYQLWREELDPGRPKTLAERIARWFERPGQAEPDCAPEGSIDPDMYRWFTAEELIERGRR